MATRHPFQKSARRRRRPRVERLETRLVLSSIFVDVDHLPAPGSGTEFDPYVNIQDAIDAAETGDVVHVAAGTYETNLVMRSLVDVRGAGADVTRIVGTASESGVVLFDGVAEAALSGFTISSSTPVSDDNVGVVFRGSSAGSAVLEQNVITNVTIGVDAAAPGTILNNTLVSVLDETGIRVSGGPTPVTIRNNIVTGYASAGIHVVAGSGVPGPVIEHNDVFDNAANYRNLPDQTGRNGNLSADPLFVARDDFQLMPGSPAIDAGSFTTGADLDGTPRDLGAFFFNQKTTNVFTADFAIERGHTVPFALFNVTTPGTIRADIAWTGDSDTIDVFLTGRRRPELPDPSAAYAMVSGTSPLTLVYEVTEADLARGVGWRLALQADSAATATSGNLQLTVPFDPEINLAFERERISLESGDHWPSEPLQRAFLDQLAATEADALHGLISTHRVCSCYDTFELEQLGVIRQSFLPGNDAFGRVPKNVDVTDPKLASRIRFLTPLEPEDKIDPHILVGNYSTFDLQIDGQFVTPDFEIDGEPLGRVNDVLNDDGTLELLVEFAEDTAESRIISILTTVSGVLVDPTVQSLDDQAWFVTLAEDRLLDLAEHDEVRWIGAGGELLLPTNDIARTVTKADLVQDIVSDASGIVVGDDGLPLYNGLTGRGVTVAIADNGIEAGHPDLNVVDNRPLFDRRHGTHVAGIVAASGVQSSAFDVDADGSLDAPFRYRGIAPEAELIDQPTVVLKARHLNDINQDSLDIVNHSNILGRLGHYNVRARMIDKMVRGDARSLFRDVPPRPIVFAAGNQGTTPQYGSLSGYHSVMVQSKNVIVVGNWSGTFTGGSLASGSSLGPTFDGRLKPDVVAPGTNITSTASAGKNEVQFVAIGPGAGTTFTLGFRENTTATVEFTAPIPLTATAADVEAALELVSGIGAGNVNVTGGPLPGNQVRVAFTDGLGDRNLPSLLTTGPAVLARNCNGDGANPDGYLTLCGTSMAAPVVTGIGALLLQGWNETYASSLETDIDANPPLPATLRAIIAQTARDIVRPAGVTVQSINDIDSDSIPDNGNDGMGTPTATVGPDYATGWGLVDADEAVMLLQDARIEGDVAIPNQIIQDTISQDRGIEYEFNVASTDDDIRLTLAWDDPSGSVLTPKRLPKLVNDLDLELIAPDGTIFFPWQLGHRIVDPFDPTRELTREEQLPGADIAVSVPIQPALLLDDVRVTGALLGDGPDDYVPTCAINGTPDTVCPAGMDDIWSARRGTSATGEVTKDHLNNIEQVFIPATETSVGKWRARVMGFRINTSRQDFALVGMPNPSLSEIQVVSNQQVALSALDEDLPVSFTIRNDSDEPTGGSFEYQMFLSRDFFVSEDDVPLDDGHTERIGELLAREEERVDTSVRIQRADVIELFGYATDTTRPDAELISDLIDNDVFLLVRADSNDEILERQEENTAALQIARDLDLVLLIDRSGSMNARVRNSVGRVPKIDQLESAANLFLDLMRIGTGDRLAEVSFAENARTDFGPSAAEEALRGLTLLRSSDTVDEIRDVIENLPINGKTDIHDALVRALGVLSVGDTGQRRRVAILLSDGRQNQPGDPLELIDDFGVAEIDTFSVGFGDRERGGSASIDLELLQALTTESEHGFFEFADSAEGLNKFFVNAAANAVRSEVIVDPAGPLASGETQEVPIPVGTQDSSVTFIVTWDHPAIELGVSLQTPWGFRLDESRFEEFGDSIRVVKGPQPEPPTLPEESSAYKLITVHLPLQLGLIGEHGGAWKLQVHNPTAATVEFSASAITQSTVRADMPAPVPSSGLTFDSGEAIPLGVSVTQRGGLPLNAGRASVIANVPLVTPGDLLASKLAELPPGVIEASLATVPMGIDGDEFSEQERLLIALQQLDPLNPLLRRGDLPPESLEEVGRGAFATAFGGTAIPGVYRFVTTVDGLAEDCQLLQREISHSATVDDEPVAPEIHVSLPADGIVTATIVPHLVSDAFVGPGLLPLIGIETVGLTPSGPPRDNGDGSYSRDFQVGPNTTSGELEVAIDGVKLRRESLMPSLPAPLSVMPSAGRGDEQRTIQIAVSSGDLSLIEGGRLVDGQRTVMALNTFVDQQSQQVFLEFPEGVKPGEYRVQLLGPSGRSPSSVSYRVLAYGQTIPDSTAALQQSINRLVDAEDPQLGLQQLGLMLRHLRNHPLGPNFTEQIRDEAIGEAFQLFVSGQGQPDPAALPFILDAGQRSDIDARVGESCIVVNQAGDVDDGDPTNGLTTLREAINIANATSGFDRICFALGHGNRTITLENTPLPAVADDLSIVGTSDWIDIVAAGTTRIFENQGAILNLSALTLRGGRAELGGAILNVGGDMTIRDVTLTNHQTETSSVANRGGGGALATIGGIVSLHDVLIFDNVAAGAAAVGTDNAVDAFGGALLNVGGVLEVRNSTLRGNQAAGGSAEDGVAGKAHGGAIAVTANGTLIVESTTISESKAAGGAASGGQGVAGDGRGGGVYVEAGGGASFFASTLHANQVLSGDSTAAAEGGGLWNEGTLALFGVTLSDNATSGDGGGLYDLGGAQLVNTTISGNHADRSGGGVIAASFNGAFFQLSTIANNVADSDGDADGRGGGFLLGPQTQASLENTLLVGNRRGAEGSSIADDGSGQAFGKFNLIGDGTGLQGLVHGDMGNQVGGVQIPAFDPASVIELELRDNNGPTWTHALAPGSPALDAGDPDFDVGSQIPTIDQRGIFRPQDGTGDLVFRPDIGAFELQRLLLDTGANVPFPGAPDVTGHSNLALELEGGRLRVTDSDTELELDAVVLDPRGSLTVLGTDANDNQLTLDFSGGDLVPDGGVRFVGGKEGFDTLTVTGDTQLHSVTHDFLNSSDGAVTIDPDGSQTSIGTITYEGLEPIDAFVTAEHVILNLPDAYVRARLSNEGAGHDNTNQLVCLGGGCESFAFRNPTESLTVRAGSSGASIEVDESFDIGNVITRFAASVSIVGSEESDTVRLESADGFGSRYDVHTGDGDDQVLLVASAAQALLDFQNVRIDQADGLDVLTIDASLSRRDHAFSVFPSLMTVSSVELMSFNRIGYANFEKLQFFTPTSQESVVQVRGTDERTESLFAARGAVEVEFNVKPESVRGPLNFRLQRETENRLTIDDRHDVTSDVIRLADSVVTGIGAAPISYQVDEVHTLDVLSIHATSATDEVHLTNTTANITSIVGDRGVDQYSVNGYGLSGHNIIHAGSNGEVITLQLDATVDRAAHTLAPLEIQRDESDADGARAELVIHDRPTASHDIVVNVLDEAVRFDLHGGRIFAHELAQIRYHNSEHSARLSVGGSFVENSLSVAPLGSRSAAVLIGGEPYTDISQDFFARIPGVMDPAVENRPADLFFDGLDPAGIRLEGITRGTQAIVYAPSEEPLVREGRTVLPGFGVGNAFDEIEVSDSRVVITNNLLGQLLPVHLEPSWFVRPEGSEHLPGLIVNSGFEANESVPGVPGATVADQVTVIPSSLFAIKINGGDPDPDASGVDSIPPDGDQLLLDVARGVSIASDGEPRPTHTVSFPLSSMLFPIIYSSIETVSSVPSSLRGFKYEDLDANGTYEEGVDAGLPGVTFMLSGTDLLGDPVEAVAVTDANGRFVFDGLSAGEYVISEVVPTGWMASTAITYLSSLGAGEHVVAFEGQAMLPPGSTRTEIVAGPEIMFGNYRPVAVHGRKFHDLNADGAHDAGEPYLDGWTIRLQDATGNIVATQDTHEQDGERGWYWFEGLVPGNYTIVEESRPGWRQSLPATGHLLLPGDADQNGVLNVNDALTIFSALFLSTPMEACLAVVDWDGNGILDLRDGLQLLEHVSRGGSPHVLGTARIHIPSCDTSSYEVDLRSGESRDDLDFGNYLPASLHGFKFEDVNGNGSYDASIDRPMEGVAFELRGTDAVGGVVSSTVVTNERGEFWLTDLRPGPHYEVIEHVPDGYRSSTGSQFETALSSGQVLVAFAGLGMLEPTDPRDEIITGGLSFGNYLPVTFQGRKFFDVLGNGVRDPGDHYLNGWTILLTHDDGTVMSAVTADDESGSGRGWYRFENVRPGNYTIGEVLQPGWVQTAPTPVPPGEHRVTLRSGETPTTSFDFGNRRLGPTIVIDPGDGTVDMYGTGEADETTVQGNLTDGVVIEVDGEPLDAIDLTTGLLFQGAIVPTSLSFFLFGGDDQLLFNGASLPAVLVDIQGDAGSDELVYIAPPTPPRIDDRLIPAFINFESGPGLDSARVLTSHTSEQLNVTGTLIDGRRLIEIETRDTTLQTASLQLRAFTVTNVALDAGAGDDALHASVGHLILTEPMQWSLSGGTGSDTIHLDLTRSHLVSQDPQNSSHNLSIQVAGGSLEETSEEDRLFLDAGGDLRVVRPRNGSPQLWATEAGSSAFTIPVSVDGLDTIVAAPGSQRAEIVGDDNDPLIDRPDHIRIIGQDVDATLPPLPLQRDAFQPDADGVHEFTVEIDGGAAIGFRNVTQLAVRGWDAGGPTDVPATVTQDDDIDVIEVQPYADNQPQGWGVSLVADGGLGDDQLIYHTAARGGPVSERIVLVPARSAAGELRTSHAATPDAIATISYLNIPAFSVVDSDGHLTDTDTLTLQGTDSSTGTNFGRDHFNIRPTATGTSNDAVAIVSNPKDQTEYYRLQSIDGFRLLNIDALGGVDHIDVTPNTEIAVRVAGGLPAGASPGFGDLLNIATTADVTVTTGPDADEGAAYVAQMAPIDFDEIELVLVDGLFNDADGLSDAIEDGAPNKGDGNADGIPDKRQPHVASLPNAITGEYVTLVSPAGLPLVNVHALTTPSETARLPAGLVAPVGFVAFAVEGLPVGGSAEIHLLMPPGVDASASHHYAAATDDFFAFERKGNIGAELRDLNDDGTDDVLLLFLDGGRGDADGVRNGVIVDPSAPTINPAPRLTGFSLPAVATRDAPVRLDATIADVAGDRLALVLDWGDGFVETQTLDTVSEELSLTFSHIYETSETFTVQLRLTDLAGSVVQQESSLEIGPPVDTDGDGQLDHIEDQALNGDGNRDGIPDREQPHVVSLPNAADASFITMVGPLGTSFKNVTATATPAPNPPPNANFQLGFFHFELHGVESGGTTTVTFLGPSVEGLQSYWKYGAEPQIPDPHFFLYFWNGSTGLRVENNQFVLHYRDGARGDNDLTANGIIVDPGAASPHLVSPWQNPFEPLDVNRDGFITPAGDVLPLINEVNQRRILREGGRLPDFPSQDLLPFYNYYDVSGDWSLSPVQDILPLINFMNRSSGGEGEAARVLGGPSPDLGTSDHETSVDRVFETWEDRRFGLPEAETPDGFGVPRGGRDMTLAEEEKWIRKFAAESFEETLEQTLNQLLFSDLRE